MKSKFLIIFLASLLLSNFAFSQCETFNYNQELYQNGVHPEDYYKHIRSQIEELQTNAKTTTHNKVITYTIPVVFHIIHNYGIENIPDSIIEDQMHVLNEDFQRLNADTVDTRSIFAGVAADCEIEFKLAKIDPEGNCTNGVTRTQSRTGSYGGNDGVKSLINWPSDSYMNIWVVGKITSSTSEFTTGDIFAFTTLPYTLQDSTLDSIRDARDGIVIRSDYVGSNGKSSGRRLVHEVGHWLGLLHPYDGGCSGGDGIADTPPQAEYSGSCSYSHSPENTCNNDNPDLMDQEENFMSNGSGYCGNMFTIGQRNLMHSILSDTNYRMKNVSSTNLIVTGVNSNPACAPIADFFVTGDYFQMQNRLSTCIGGTLDFEDLSYNGDVLNRTWTFEGGIPSSSNAASPSVTYAEEGSYNVTLVVSNSSGTNEIVKYYFVQVLPKSSSLKAPFLEAFDGSLYERTGWRWDGYHTDRVNELGWRLGATGTSDPYLRCVTGSLLPNERKSLTTPPIDVSNLEGLEPKLSFRTSYSKPDWKTSDILHVWASIDCGKTWQSLMELKTSTGLMGPDSSLEDTWVTHSTSLSDYDSESTLRLRFEVEPISGYTLSLDDIYIGKFPLSVKEPEPISFNVYPNPNTGHFNIEILELGPMDKLCIVDNLGRVVYELKNPEPFIELNQNLSVGVYTILVSQGGLIGSKKIFVIE